MDLYGDTRPFIKENGDIDYIFLTIRGLTNPMYLTNISIFLTLLFLVFKNKKMVNCLNPLLITNGVFISIYCLIYLENFDIESLKYVFPKEYKDPSQHNTLLKLANTPTFIGFYKYTQPLVHFWLPILIYYLGFTKNKNEHCSVLESFVVFCVIIGIYACVANNDTYNFVMNSNTFKRDIFAYITLHIIITFVYFYS